MNKITKLLQAHAMGIVLGLGLIGSVAVAQYAPQGSRDYQQRDYQRDYQTGGNPLDDFFQRMDRNNPNPTLVCQTYKRLNRQGEIVWMRMECSAQGR